VPFKSLPGHHLIIALWQWLSGPRPEKINVFGTIFKVNSNIGKLWDLLGHFWLILINTIFYKQFYNAVRAYNNCLIFAQTVRHLSGRG